MSVGLRLIGLLPSSAQLTATIGEGGGYAEGVLQRIGLFGDTADISVR